MHAMVFNEKRDFIWAEVPDPAPREGEVLIRIRAAAVNRADLFQRGGSYAPPAGWPEWCGLECAGEVVAAPAGSSVRPGDAVCALLGGGGYAEYVCVPVGMVAPIPEGFSFVEAASIPEVWCTVYLNLVREAGGIGPGDVFFVQAGASGIGVAAIQFAKLMGARVIATVGSPEKGEFVRNLGADVVVNRRTDDLHAVLAAEHPSIALDCVGGTGMGDCFREMAFLGRWIMIATLAERQTTIDLDSVWRKRLKLIGSTLRSRSSEEKASIIEGLRRDLWPHFASRRLVTHIHATFPLQEADAAQAVLRRGENIGKVVMTVD